MQCFFHTLFPFLSISLSLWCNYWKWTGEEGPCYWASCENTEVTCQTWTLSITAGPLVKKSMKLVQGYRAFEPIIDLLLLQQKDNLEPFKGMKSSHSRLRENNPGFLIRYDRTEFCSNNALVMWTNMHSVKVTVWRCGIFWRWKYFDSEYWQSEYSLRSRSEERRFLCTFGEAFVFSWSL